MPQKDKRIDEYIKKAQPFAQPIMRHLRELIHEAVPEVTETIKWGMPYFDYKGLLCSFASFKQHAVFGFWKGPLISDPKGYLQERSAKGGEAMGHLGRITSLSDLPPDKVLIGFIRQAKKLNDEGAKVPDAAKKIKPVVPVPDYFTNALKRNRKAKSAFDTFSPSHQREYVEWITEAKTEATREKRLDQALEMLCEGKKRNWKYEQKLK
ncbi:MAG TPA: YdeI/OmpD-associated family protein [Chitinophagaceae bacterium]